jgi:TRAP-type uncharacterized transport system fused permease subunit
VYVLLATLVAPGLVEIGIEPIAAHLFVMYYGMMSMITPPVAVAAFTAAGIAGANPMKTAMASVKIGWLAYVIPFIFVFSPGLTLHGSFGDIATAVSKLVAGILLISIAMTGYFLRPMNVIRRTVALIAGSIICIPTNADASSGMLLAVATITGILLLASEIAVARRSAGKPGENNNA